MVQEVVKSISIVSSEHSSDVFEPRNDLVLAKGAWKLWMISASK